MFSIRYLVKLFSTFIPRFKGIILLGILLGFISFVFLKFLSPIFLKKTTKIGVSGRFHPEELPLIISSQIGEGLTNIDATGQVIPGLAENWETPDSGKTWIFHLCENKYWQDGERISSENIKYNFQDVEIQRPNENTLVFVLDSPLAPFPAVVSRPIFKKGLLASGEWKVSKLSLTGNFVQKLVLINNEGEKRIFKFYPSEERTKLAFKLGEIDWIQGLINPDPFDIWKTVKIKQNINENQYVAIFFNIQDKYLSDKSLRQTLAYAIDKKQFKEKRALGPLSSNSWAYNSQTKPYNFNQGRAQELITDQPQELRENLNIKLATTPVLLDIAEKIADNWERVGIKTTVQVTSILPEEYQAFLAIYDIPRDPDQYPTWHSSQSETNISNYSNPRIDKLLEDGRLELDQEERKKIYLDFQRFLVEDSPAVFLFHPISYTVIRK